MFAIHAAYFCFIRIMANFTDKGGKLASGLSSESTSALSQNIHSPFIVHVVPSFPFLASSSRLQGPKDNTHTFDLCLATEWCCHPDAISGNEH